MDSTTSLDNLDIECIVYLDHLEEHRNYEFCRQTEWVGSGDARYADPENVGTGANARLRNRGDDRADQPRSVSGERGVALPRVPALGARRAYPCRMALDGEQSACQVLCAYTAGTSQTQARHA